MSNIDQSIIEFFGGYNSFYRWKNDIRLLCDEGKLCFKLGSKNISILLINFYQDYLKLLK